MSARRSSSRVWVLPNRNTIGLVAVLLAMWYAGASQTNGAAYLLGFVLAGVASVSAVHGWANLRGVVFSADPIAPAFAGDQMIVSLAASSERHRSHFAIDVHAHGGVRPASFSEITASDMQRVRLSAPAIRRGVYGQLRLRASTIYPLGFFTARRAIRIGQPYYIYPAPEGSRPLPRAFAPTRQPRDGHRAEGDDYGGVRAWQPGESQRHIDWKAAARGQPLLIKQWTGDADEILHLDWQALEGIGDEARLSQLSRWVIMAESTGASYGLRIPGKVIPPARGEAHYHACLRELATFTVVEGKAEP